MIHCSRFTIFISVVFKWYCGRGFVTMKAGITWKELLDSQWTLDLLDMKAKEHMHFWHGYRISSLKMQYYIAAFDNALLYKGGYFHIQICKISLLSSTIIISLFTPVTTHVPTIFLFPFFIFDFWNPNILLGYYLLN